MEEQIQELEKRVTAIEQAQNLDMKALLFDNLFNTLGSYDSTLERTVSVPSTPTSFVIPENPINTLIINYKGVNYRLLLYSLS